MVLPRMRFRFNRRLASCGETCLNLSSVLQINFSAVLTVLCPEITHERQAQKPYQAFVGTDDPKQIWKSHKNVITL